MPGDRVRLVASPLRLRTKRFLGRRGVVLTGPVSFPSGELYGVRLEGDIAVDRRFAYVEELERCDG